MTTYKTLLSALSNVGDEQIVVAQDISAAGQKIFLKGTTSQLRDIYDKLNVKHWYECLMEDRPSRIFLDVESLGPVDIDSILDFMRQAISHKFNIEADISCINSCSSTKYSWHILCTNVYLKNVYHVGAFVRRLILSMSGHQCRNAIDAAVYTKNRMFRVLGSSKFGSERVLRMDTGAQTWTDLLVQRVGAEWQECLEIDESQPCSTSMHPDKMFTQTKDGWRRIRGAYNRSNASAVSSCPMLQPILDWLDKHVGACTCRHNTSFTPNGRYFVSTRSKQCAIAKREHKGNNIWFDIDCQRQIVYQRCYDQDCYGHALPVPIPQEQWSMWNRTWHQLIHAPRNEKTLFRVSP